MFTTSNRGFQIDLTMVLTFTMATVIKIWMMFEMGVENAAWSAPMCIMWWCRGVVLGRNLILNSSVFYRNQWHLTVFFLEICNLVYVAKWLSKMDLRDAVFVKFVFVVCIWNVTGGRDKEIVDSFRGWCCVCICICVYSYLFVFVFVCCCICCLNLECDWQRSRDCGVILRKVVLCVTRL